MFVSSHMLRVLLPYGNILIPGYCIKAVPTKLARPYGCTVHIARHGHFETKENVILPQKIQLSLSYNS